MRMQKTGDGVYVLDEPYVAIGRRDIETLISLASEHPKLRVRLCAHTTPEDKVHEMFIAMLKGSYVRPHKHQNKVESFHVIEGEAEAVEFTEDGKVTSIVKIGAGEPGVQFYYRNPSPAYHTWNILSDVFVVHEITNGPFQPGSSMPAPWSPADADNESVAQFLRDLAHELRRLKGSAG
jgi:cupin fold WbuC family metalloprotein